MVHPVHSRRYRLVTECAASDAAVMGHSNDIEVTTASGFRWLLRWAAICATRSAPGA